MPEGKCRRPHRQHESIYLFAKDERHRFRTSPPVGSVWEFGNEKIPGLAHYSRFPLELPTRCINSYGTTGRNVVVFDPFSGSGTTGVAALKAGCSYLGFEIDADQVHASNERLRATRPTLVVEQAQSNDDVAEIRQLSSRNRSSAKTNVEQMRKWAQTNGYQVSGRGRVPKAVVEAYQEAAGE